MKKSISISSKQLLKLTIDSLEDDKGIDRYSTEINCQEFTFLNTKNEMNSSTTTSKTISPQVETDSSEDSGDDLPF